MKQFYKPLLLILFLFGSGIMNPNHIMAYQDTEEDPCEDSMKYLYWTGDVDNDFFNEMNWRETVQKPSQPNAPGQDGFNQDQPVKPACLPGENKPLNAICVNEPNLEKDKTPKSGTLDPGKPILYNLYMASADIVASGEILFACADKGMTLSDSKLNASSGITQGVISLNDESTLKITALEIPLAVKFDFLDPASWIYWNGITPDVFGNSLDSHIKISGLETTVGSGYRVNQYYQTGSLIRPIDAIYTTLTIFSETYFGGIQGELNELTIYKGAEIPNGLNNAAHSFVLKRGYMATFAVHENGTSKGKVFIASEEDMYVDAFPDALQGNVSFIRVVPWNWVTKKGTGGFIEGLDAGWYYNWGLGNTSRPNYEYVPMAWGAGGASPANVNSAANRGNVTHFLGFNESDNCNGESGQFNNLCQPEVAVAYFEGLMASGLRIGSPAPRENGPTGWLREFYEIAKARDVRFDYVAVHWYDWGSGPANSPNADPQVIFNRFKAYLENVYSIYQMPIWVTEFNANPNRGNNIQQAFLELALPYLESLEYVERYAFFQPNPANSANPNVTTSFYFDADGNLTNIGELYLNHQSTPSIKDATYAPNNSLEGMDLPFVPKEISSNILEAECGDYLGSQWDVIANENASNGFILRGNAQNEGESPIARQVHFEFELEDADSYRIWFRGGTAGANGALRFKVDNGPMEQIGGFNSNGLIWFQVPRFYDLGVGKHRLTIEFPNNTMRLDQVAFVNGPVSLDAGIQELGYCQPTDNFWGLVQSDVMDFYESESAFVGSGWTVGLDEKAINGMFIETEGQTQSLETAPEAMGLVEFEFEVEAADEYEIWAKIQALDLEGESSLWIAVDDQPFSKFADLQNDLFLWYWKKFHYTYESDTRSFSYFLEAGRHNVKIAYASGNVAIDRIAVATAGKNPSEVDPEVVNLVENLKFEAELATLLGSASIVNCATSSNGQQVNMGTVNTNGVKFDEVVALESGAYKLQVSYMSAVTRNFRLSVNGVNLGRQIGEDSGEWCFNNGIPAIYEITVNLNEGLNIIEITPFDGAAPFIDKIKLEKSGRTAPTFISLEAEEAELVGTFPTPTCATASNGQIVNMGFIVSHQINFRNVNVDVAGTYNVEFHYFTPVVRSMRIITNGTPRTVSFGITGAFCGGGGSPGTQTVEFELQAGNNVIQLTPIIGEAPIMDKIVVTNQETDVDTTRKMEIEEVQFTAPTFQQSLEFKVYPNPVRAGETIHIQLPNVSNNEETIGVSLVDMQGITRFLDNAVSPETQNIAITANITKGLYIVHIQQGNQWLSKKIIVE
ncbi:glycosyl hydrolase [Aquiflexum sp.]|uniref:glycosyl hydrolase n=1 Tax=Aquiflexum sp. TaxID=1872584 RepID=UPI003594139F